MKRSRRVSGVAAGAVALIGLAACGGDGSADVQTPISVPAARVFFVDPSDGSSVTNPVEVAMDAERFDIELAGRVARGSGHFHLMVDVGCVAPGETIPAGESHIHYGNAQRRAELVLPPGEHSLCLQAGDGAHTALDLTDQLKVTVTS